MLSKAGVCREEGGRSCIEDWEFSPVCLEFNSALFPADNNDKNMAADTFAPGMVPGPSHGPACPQLLPGHTEIGSEGLDHLFRADIPRSPHAQ